MFKYSFMERNTIQRLKVNIFPQHSDCIGEFASQRLGGHL